MSAQASATTNNNKDATDTQQNADVQTKLNQEASLTTKELSNRSTDETQQADEQSLDDNTLANTSALAEIEALQQAILNNEDFDFSTLEAPSAGIDAAIIDTENSDHLLSAPPVMESTHTNIHYYSDTQPVTSSETPANTPTLAINLTDNDALNLTTVDIGGELFSLTEDFSTQFEGKINSDFVFDTNSQNTRYGVINVNPDGEYRYSLDNHSADIQALGAGDSLTDTIILSSKSGGAIYTLELTINGTNDKAFISGDQTGDIQTLSNTEQSIFTMNNNGETVLIQTSGHIINEDIDAGESGFKAETNIEATYGTASINTQGEWIYSLDHTLDSVISLADNKQLSDFFSVETLDGSNQLIEVSIQGANDAPIFLNNANSVAFNLAESSSISGDSPISDPDFNQSYYQPSDSIQGLNGYGTGSIDENGHWTYTVDETNSDITSLHTDDFVKDYFFITTADGTQQSIIIQIDGSDNPAFAQNDSEKDLTIETSSITLDFSSLISDTQNDAEFSEFMSSNTDSRSQVSNTEHIESGNSENAILQQLSQQDALDLI